MIDIDRVTEYLRHKGLAWCCVIAPILFGIGLFGLTSSKLLPIGPDFHSPLDYRPVKLPDKTRAKDTKETKDAKDTVPAAAQKDVVFFTLAQHIQGRIIYGIASGFIYLVSAAAFVLATAIVVRRVHWKMTARWLLVFGVISVCLAWSPLTPPGRQFLLRDLLDKADGFPGVGFLALRGGTGQFAETLVAVNTFVSFWAVGMILAALWALSVRPSDNVLNRNGLEVRRQSLQSVLGISSALLVVGVLAQKALLDWPLALIANEQAEALRPLASALSLQMGAMSSIALISAFAPAIVRWMLDAARLQSRAGGEGKKQDADATPPLVFAKISTISGVVAVLAPLLASPLVDALKSLLATFGKS